MGDRKDRTIYETRDGVKVDVKKECFMLEERFRDLLQAFDEMNDVVVFNNIEKHMFTAGKRNLVKFIRQAAENYKKGQR